MSTAGTALLIACQRLLLSASRYGRRWPIADSGGDSVLSPRCCHATWRAFTRLSIRRSR